jgi:hypothetical protein
MPAKLGDTQRQWAEQAEADGWVVELNDDQHLTFKPPDKTKPPIVIPGRKFPHGNRSQQNNRAALRRAGLDI